VGYSHCINVFKYTVEDQAENEKYGVESKACMKPLQKVDQFSAAVQHVKLVKHAAMRPDEPVKQPDDSAKRPDKLANEPDKLANEPDKQATRSLSAEQPSMKNQPKQSLAIPGQCYGDEFPILTQTNRKNFTKTRVPTKPVYTRKLPTFKVCSVPFVHV